jgi:hypothetical protein
MHKWWRLCSVPGVPTTTCMIMAASGCIDECKDFVIERC